jgi:hypothetical protein
MIAFLPRFAGRTNKSVPAARFLRAGLFDPFPPMNNPGRRFACPGKEIKEAERRQARISNLRTIADKFTQSAQTICFGCGSR